VFPSEGHVISPSTQDVDYDGDQRVSASYGMVDLPLDATLTLLGGARLESTEISIVNSPEPDAQWIKPGNTAPVDMNPGDGDVSFSQDDVLPMLGLSYVPTSEVTVRASYSQTVARQTFKELSPILQQEYLGGPIFIGNPDLAMSALKNYDLRLDYTPAQGSLVSVSWFHKTVDGPIEYVQELADFATFTTPRNYPHGELGGYEAETRQDLGRFTDDLRGFSLGANATFIDSEVELPADEAASLAATGAPITSRDMTGAPAYLYNLYLTYDMEQADAQAAVFWTVEGDTLVAGAGEARNRFVPSVYSKEFGTLNVSYSRRIGKNFRLQLQAKNLTNPEIETVYRSEFTGGDTSRSTYTRGREFSLGLSVNL